jgi:phage regulator Rha-like protein
MESLVLTDGDKAYTTTLIISEGVGNDHRNVMRLLKKYSGRELLSTFETAKVSRGGRPVEYAKLDEQQTTFLITLMNNSDEVVRFKELLTKEFFKQRHDASPFFWLL